MKSNLIYKLIILISIFSFMAQASQNEKELPYFKDMGGYCIENKDDQRWSSAIAAAMKLPLLITTNKEILSMFGQNPATSHGADGTYEYTYQYLALPHNKKEDASKQNWELKNFIVLFFAFDNNNQLQAVGLKLQPCPPPEVES